MQFHDINLYYNSFKMFGILQDLHFNADKRSEGQKLKKINKKRVNNSLYTVSYENILLFSRFGS